jgi:hypothetical protein
VVVRALATNAAPFALRLELRWAGNKTSSLSSHRDASLEAKIHTRHGCWLTVHLGVARGVEAMRMHVFTALELP